MNLPPYLPKLNPIALVTFQLLGQRLYQSNTKHKSRDTKCDDYFMLKCVEGLESISNDDVRKNLKKRGYNIYNYFLKKIVSLTFGLIEGI